MPLLLPVVEMLEILVWVLLVPLPTGEELGGEAVVGTRLLLGVTEDATLGADVGLSEDTEEKNPVEGVDDVPLPEVLVTDDVDDMVCVVESVSEVSEEPIEPYEEEEEGDTVGMTRLDELAELEPKFEGAITLDDTPGLLMIVLEL